MIRTILVLCFDLAVTTLALPLVLIGGVFKLFRLYTLERWYITPLAGFFGWFFLATAGAGISVEGKEHLKGLKGKPLCVVGNHQGIADIPVVVHALPFSIGFIAKKSLTYFPWVGILMWMIRCVPIDRSSPRSSVKAIDKGVRNIRNGFPMLIFPEGTRSKGGEMKSFKKGSLKLATRAEAIILPVSINGSYRFFEEKGRLASGKASVTFHAPIHTAGMSKEELAGLTSRVEEVVRSAVVAG